MVGDLNKSTRQRLISKNGAQINQPGLIDWKIEPSPLSSTNKMAAKLLFYFAPVPFFFLTYYLLFSGKKTTRRNDNDKSRQVVTGNNGRKPECSSNFHLVNGNCVRCPRGQFSFQGWIACLHWLDCANIALDVRIRRRIGIPGHLNAVKEVYLADWNGYDVVYSKCASEMFYEDCVHGMKMVEGLQGSEFVVQLIGICYSGSLEVKLVLHNYACNSRSHAMTLYIH